ncbi:hypothetical protein D9M68_724580 [compost metagenome]
MPGVLPMYRALAVGAVVNNVCVSSVAGTGNKLGNIAYLRFTAPANRDYQVTVGNAAVPDFDVFRGGEIARSGNRVSLSAGEYVLAVRDAAMTGSSASPLCLSVLVQ